MSAKSTTALAKKEGDAAAGFFLVCGLQVRLFRLLLRCGFPPASARLHTWARRLAAGGGYSWESDKNDTQKGSVNKMF